MPCSWARPCVPVRCHTPAGSHSARVGGSTQWAEPTFTAATPWEAHTSWCWPWTCHGNQLLDGSGRSRSSMAPCSCLYSDITWQSIAYRTHGHSPTVEGMPMNYFHRKICSSEKWAQGVAQILPRRLDGFDLGDRMLEIGPGYGATTRVLAGLTG